MPDAVRDSEVRAAGRTISDVSPEEWKAPGRKTIVGYLMVSRGGRKRDYGLLGNVIADALEEVYGETSKGRIPRYKDSHSVWFGFDPEGKPGHQMQRPFLRYRAEDKEIPGLEGREHHHHRVELTCTIAEPWANGVGAHITRAEGRCLDCA